MQCFTTASLLQALSTHSACQCRNAYTCSLLALVPYCSPYCFHYCSILLQKTITDQEQTLKHARVTGVTCAGSVSSVQLQQGGPYDIIILDECSQQIEPLSLLPLAASQALRTVLVCISHHSYVYAVTQVSRGVLIAY
jgi:AAA domain